MRKFIFSFLLCQGAALIGSVFTIAAIPTWYAQLHKPSFNPPNWLFGPVWTLLYTLMAVALYLIWKQGLTEKTKPAIIIFLIQLALNVLWSYLFFFLKAPAIAFSEILILWLAILATIVKFCDLSRPAGLILIPYLTWVSFASVLNFFVAKLNP